MCIAPINSLMTGICSVSQLDFSANIASAVFYTVLDNSKAADVQFVPRPSCCYGLFFASCDNAVMAHTHDIACWPLVSLHCSFMQEQQSSQKRDSI